jgi:hypothetical protein
MPVVKRSWGSPKLLVWNDAPGDIAAVTETVSLYDSVKLIDWKLTWTNGQ